MRSVAYSALFLVLLFVACGSGENSSQDVAGDVPPGVDTSYGDIGHDAINDQGPVDVPVNDVDGGGLDVVPDNEPTDLPVDVPPEIWYPPVTPPLPFGPENRGYVHMNGIVHLHSRWSHDGCFPDHEEITSPDIEACSTTYVDEAEIKACRDAIVESMLVACVDEYRQAACAAGMEFLFQTDHPGDVRHQTFEDALHYRPDSGDQMVLDDQERQVANRMKCPAEAPVDHVYVYFGTEGSKQMPIGMAAPIPEIVFNTSFEDSTPLEQAREALAAVHAQGGWGLVCHPEQKDLSVQRIVELPLDLIEIFNFHPALMGILEDFNILFQLDRFMSSDQDAPNPDLAMMLVLKPVENDPLKFDESVKSIRLGHILATDIHRNVELPALCESAETCGDNWIVTYPNLAHLLARGGPAILGDGDRFDSYRRSLRWASNHALVSSTGTDYLAIRDAIGLGRSYSAFDVMGIPQDFDFFAVVDGAALEMGQETSGYTDAKIYFRTPTIEKPLWATEKFSDPSDTEIVTRLIKVDAEGGSCVVREVIGQGWTFEHEVDGPAVYRIEVWMTPKHLATDLGDMAWMADKQYPWIYSNALFFR